MGPSARRRMFPPDGGRRALHAAIARSVGGRRAGAGAADADVLLSARCSGEQTRVGLFVSTRRPLHPYLTCLSRRPSTAQVVVARLAAVADQVPCLQTRRERRVSGRCLWGLPDG